MIEQLDGQGEDDVCALSGLTPREIYQANLDGVDQTLAREAWGALVQFLLTPAIITMSDYEITIANDADLQALARKQQDSLKRMGANEYYRICESAAWVGDDRGAVAGVHRTYILRHGKPLIAPYASTMQLRLDGALWRATGIQTEIANGQVPMLSSSFGAISAEDRA